MTYSALNQKRIQIFLGVVILAGFHSFLTMRLQMSFRPSADVRVEKTQALNPELFKTMSFGQVASVVDWMWLNLLVDPSIKHVKKGTHPQIFYTLDLLTNLDPAFMEAYVEGATLVSVIRNDGPGAQHLLIKGESFREKELPKYPASFRTRYWPSPWRMPLLLAYVDLFDLQDIPHAANQFREAEAIHGAPAYLKALIQQFSEPGGEYQVGLRLLKFMQTTTDDPQVKQRLAHQEASLRVNYFLFDLNDRFQKFLDSRHLSRDDRNSKERTESLWSVFRKRNHVTQSDPWGGRIFLDKNGRISTTTAHEKVFGLE